MVSGTVTKRNRGTLPNIGTMADPVVVAEHAAMAAMTESTTTMTTEVVDYTNFDEHTYRFSSTSKKKMSRGTCATRIGWQGRQHCGELVVSR